MPEVVLFVDDDPAILGGLRRAFHRKRAVWDMHFAEGGAKALEFLAANPTKAIVCDMRMPDVSGLQVLSQAATLQPGAVRIVLSGQSEERELLPSMSVAHQFLAKPCEPERLEAVIDNALGIADYLLEPELVTLVSSLTTLPSFHSISQSIARELASDRPSGGRVADIVSGDLALTAKLLQLANSSFFSGTRPITTSSAAIDLLGSQRLLDLSVAMKLYDEVPTDPRIPFDGLWQQSTTTAAWAEKIAAAAGAAPGVVDLARTAGLLSTAGSLIFAAHFPERFLELERRVASGESPDSAEQTVFGSTGPGLAAYVLGLWGLPQPVVEAVAVHRNPSERPTDGFTAATAVHVAAALLSGLLSGHEVRLDQTHLDAIAAREEVDRWIAVCTSRRTVA